MSPGTVPGHTSSRELQSSLLLRKVKSRHKHVNTCSYHFWRVTMNELRVIIPCYMDRGHLYELVGVKIYICMCPRNWDIKCSCICLSARPNSLSNAHITTCIFALSFIIHLCNAHAPLVASRNTIYLSVLLLSVRMRHLPLSYEWVSKPAIEAMRHTHRMYYRTLKFTLGQSDKFQILFSCWAWFPPHPTVYRHNENRYGQSIFCTLLKSTIQLLLWSLVWFNCLVPSKYVFDQLESSCIPMYVAIWLGQNMLGRN